MNIEERLGREVTDFAYPYGNFNALIKQITREYFNVACSTKLGKARPSDDIFALKRLDTYYLSNERVFRSVLAGNFDLYLSFRQAMRSLKSTCYSK
jgi:hypothetical protein